MTTKNESLDDLLMLAPAGDQRKLLKKIKRAYLESHLADDTEERTAALMMLRAIQKLFK